MYVLHPSDLAPYSRYGLLGLIDDLLALFIIFVIISAILDLVPCFLVVLIIAWIAINNIFASNKKR